MVRGLALWACLAPAAAQAPLDAIVSADAGGAHTCALAAGGTLWCWGDNFSGQLGTGSPFDESYYAVQAAISGVSASFAGSGTTCALVGGAVQCWGRGYARTPAPVAGLATGVASVASGRSHLCVRDSSGSARCLGDNTFGQLGRGDIGGPPADTPAAVLGLGAGVTAIEAGEFHTCAVVSGGVRCWGRNLAGELGDGSNTDSGTPVVVGGIPGPVVALGLGSSHSCAVTAAGAVYCWGSNGEGQLGIGNSDGTRLLPAPVQGLPGSVTRVTAGIAHTCALTQAGAVWCWGRNFSGELGDGTRTERTLPVAAARLASGVTSVTAGGSHTCATVVAGGIKCWGEGSAGRLGLGNFVIDSLLPRAVVAIGLAPPATLLSSGNPAPPGQPVTFTYRFSFSDPGETGTVYFFTDSGSISGCAGLVPSIIGQQGSASCTTAALSAGSTEVRAGFAPTDGIYPYIPEGRLIQFTPTAASPRRDAFGHRIYHSAQGAACRYQYVDLVGLVPELPLSGDRQGRVVPLLGLGPAGSTYYGLPQTGLVMSTHGYLSFDPGNPGYESFNFCGLGDERLKVLHDGLEVSVDGGGLRHQNFGVCPRPDARGQGLGCTVFQWTGMVKQGTFSGTPNDFQALVYENGEIAYQYRALDNDRGARATIGISGANGDGIEYACGVPESVQPLSAVCFNPPGTEPAPAPEPAPTAPLDAYEVDDRPDQARPLRPGVGWAQNRSLHDAFDVDVLQVSITRGYEWNIVFSGCTPGLDLALQVLDERGVPLTGFSSQMSGDQTAIVVDDCSASGGALVVVDGTGCASCLVGADETYYLRVTSPRHRTGSYRIWLQQLNGPESADIRGRVVDPQGIPIPDVAVRTFRQGDVFWGGDYTQPDGRFVTVVSPFETYTRLRFEKDGYQPLDYNTSVTVPDGTFLEIPGPGQSLVMTPVQTAPTLSSPQAVASSSSSLLASVEVQTNGAPTGVRFDYAMPNSPFQPGPSVVVAPSPQSATASATIPQLLCGQDYDVRGVASNGIGGEIVGPTVRGRTAPCVAPGLSNLRATGVARDVATVRVGADPRGGRARVRLILRNGAITRQVSFDIVDPGEPAFAFDLLACGTTYQMEANAETLGTAAISALGPTPFTTDACAPGPPAAESVGASPVTQRTARLLATVDSSGVAGSATFALRPVAQPSFVDVATMPLAASGAPQALQHDATALACGTPYIVRLRASTAVGTGETTGAFTTAACQAEIVNSSVGDRTPSSATVRAILRSNRPGVAGGFEYRIRNSPEYLRTPLQALANSPSDQSLSTTLPLLPCETDFDFRAVVTQDGVTTFGPVVRFRTQVCFGYLFANEFE